MRKSLLLASCGFAVACSAGHASVFIQLDAGVLRTAGGTATEPVGGLLQIISSRSGSAANLTTPTPGAFFTGTDNLIVQNFAMNYNFGNGEVGATISFTLENTATPSLATSFDSGDPLLLRWWPGITYNTNTSAPSRTPVLGDTYGQFRSNSGEGGGIAWFVPADGTNLTVPGGLNFLTTETTDFNGNPGTHTLLEGSANLVVVVPEPSTYALLALGLGGLTFGAMQRRRRAVV